VRDGGVVPGTDEVAVELDAPGEEAVPQHLLVVDEPPDLLLLRALGLPISFEIEKDVSELRRWRGRRILGLEASIAT
jgi:hypothetical protein